MPGVVIYRRRLIARVALWLSLAAVVPATAQQDAAPDAAARKIGTVKAINGKTVALKADSGPDVNIIIQDSTRLAQLPAGQTDLKAATPIQLQDVQVGDRMLARGKAGSDGQSLMA